MKKGSDGVQHYAVVGVVLQVNNKSENYATYGASLTDGTKESYLKSVANDVISSYTLEEIEADQKAVQQAILQKYQDEFGKDLIVTVGFSSFTPQ